MQRELKFRARSMQSYDTNTDSIEIGQWVHGYYYYCRERMSGIIVTTMMAESGGVGSGLVQVEILVDEKTVGQYTGLKDKNGMEIYEGDVVKTTHGTTEIESVMDLYLSLGYRDCKQHKYVSVPQETMSIFERTVKIIGNIHENPELL